MEPGMIRMHHHALRIGGNLKPSWSRNDRGSRDVEGCVIGRNVFALALIVGLLFLPGATAQGSAASCCGSDCGPCPLSFCKTTRADRAALPPAFALALPAVDPLSLGVFRAIGMPAPAENAAASRVPASFHPMRS